MNHATQCPSCQTRFKVTDAQLAAAEGMVRCGRCAHVFNAREHLEGQTPPPAPPASAADDFELELPDFDPILPPGVAPDDAAPEPAPPPVEPTAMAAPADAASEAGERNDDLDVFERALKEAMNGGRREPSATRIETLADAGDERRAPVETASAAEHPEHPEPAEAPEAPLPLAAPEPAAARDDDAEEDDEPGPSRALLMTLIFALLSLLALLLLLGQLVYFNRTRIAAEVPELRPTLEAACRPLGCSVPLPGDAEAIRTEWSELSFVPEHAHLVQVSATLKNHAPYPQAFPAMELTLKDDDDQVLVRRNFAASDYLKPDDFKAGYLPGNGEVKVTMKLDTGKLKPQGYSLLWFYP
ncbi:putative Zn finger-like uncharacterized protein [Crenobacter luteus]|uniref:DUF3426 domain-containing protein n=1 Tax=Crenobacter luteus TaxID=1452487 RepID=UPI001046956F|nr:DUF3426 domain-containing protein [Crenobacter luteus]TCP11032.1 putative Zn finger-like uncharacterized protein [Crenobacter luteus]